jgi:hypothetical protein
VTSLEGNVATAVVADLSRAVRLPSAGAQEEDLIAVIALVLSLLVGISSTQIAPVREQARESLNVNVWDNLLELLQSHVNKTKLHELEEVRRKGVFATAFVCVNKGASLGQLASLLTTNAPDDRSIADLIGRADRTKRPRASPGHPGPGKRQLAAATARVLG